MMRGRVRKGAEEWDVSGRDDIRVDERDGVSEMSAEEADRVKEIYEHTHKIAGDGQQWGMHNATSTHWMMWIRAGEWRKVKAGVGGVREGLMRGGGRGAKSMAEGATIEVWNAQDVRYERRRVIRVRKGIPTLEEDGGIRVDGGRYAHLMRKEESESGQWLELHKENWRWAEGDGTAARTDRPRDGAGHEGRTTVVTPPAGAWDVWTMRREEMKRDAEMRTEHGRMVDGLETAMRITGRIPARHAEARVFRGAWIAARTGQLRWKPALDSVIGGTWAGARRDERKVTDTDRGVERAVRMVQGAAGALLLRWHKIGERARRWAAHREVLRGRASVVLHAWRAVCERQRGQWRMSSRQGRERREEEDGSDELTPRWMAEWSYRPGVSAVTPGTWGGWLMAYARAHAVARRAERRRWAAWRVRATWRDGEDWGGKYRAEVQNGAWPVCVKAETMWTRWCEMNKGREVKVEGVRIKRRGSVVWIAGGLERTVRQVGRAERVVGEVWRVRVGTGRDGQGWDGPWKGAAELRRKRTRGVSKWGGGGRNIRLDAAALERRVRGLASGGDG